MHNNKIFCEWMTLHGQNGPIYTPYTHVLIHITMESYVLMSNIICGKIIMKYNINASAYSYNVQVSAILHLILLNR